MKSKIKTLRISVFTAVIVLVLISCKLSSDGKDNNVDISQYYLNPPTGLVATKLSTSELHLTWNAVSGAGRYEISIRTNLDSADTRLSIASSVTDTRYNHGYYSWYWGYYSRPEEVTTLYYYLKAHPRQSGYIASDWSAPVSVNVR